MAYAKKPNNPQIYKPTTPIHNLLSKSLLKLEFSHNLPPIANKCLENLQTSLQTFSKLSQTYFQPIEP
jgi:hypothetical protein